VAVGLEEAAAAEVGPDEAAAAEVRPDEAAAADVGPAEAAAAGPGDIGRTPITAAPANAMTTSWRRVLADTPASCADVLGKRAG
jgi:hypothetical protein